MPAIAFQPPPTSSQVAAFRDEDDETSIIVKPVDYFVLFAPASSDAAAAVRLVGYSIADGPFDGVSNFLGYAENAAAAIKKYAPDAPAPTP